MATTQPDFVISGDEWIDARTAASIPTSPIIIQNKGISDVLVNYNSQPQNTSKEGFLLTRGQAIRTNSDTIWIKSLVVGGTIYIEEDS